MIHSADKFNDSLPAGFDGLFDWDKLIPCFGNEGVSFTDIDAVVERNARFLFVETKRAGVPVPMGQTILLNTLHQEGNKTIMIIKMYGDKNIEHVAEFGVLYPNDKGIRYIIKTDTELSNPERFKVVYNEIAKWWKDANMNGKLSKREEV